jgi:hypothetical protein
MYSDLSSNDVAEIHATLKNMGVDPSALYKGSSTPIHVADVKEDGKWVTLKVKVVHIWDNTSDKITQTGLIDDETGIIKFTIWESANLPAMEEGISYEIKFSIFFRFGFNRTQMTRIRRIFTDPCASVSSPNKKERLLPPAE